MSLKNNSKQFKLLGLFLASLFIAFNALAQEAPPETNAPAPPEATTTLQETTSVKSDSQVVVDAIAAVVNKEVITVQELNDRMHYIADHIRKTKGEVPPHDVLQKQVLEVLILESAQEQLAKELGLTVKDSQLDKTIAIIAEQHHMTVEQFKKQSEQKGVPFEQFRENLRKDITNNRLRDREVIRKIQVNEAEIDHILNSSNQANAPEEIRLGHILIGFSGNDSPQQIAEKHAKAEKVLEQLKSGEDFQQVAAANSDSAEGTSGGDIGWRKTDQIPKLFTDALSGLSIGQTTGIIKSPQGFHILKVLGKKSPVSNQAFGIQTGGVQQFHARHILIKVTKLVSATDAKRKLIDLKTRIQNKSATFEELAKTYSNDTSASRGGDLGWIYLGDTVPEFEKALTTLQIGELSDPVETQYGFHLIQVLEKKTDDISNERKRAAIRQSLRQKKIAEATEEWLHQVRDRAYVEYRLNTQN